MHTQSGTECVQRVVDSSREALSHWICIIMRYFTLNCNCSMQEIGVECEHT